MFRVTFKVPLSVRSLAYMLEALTRINVDYLRNNPQTPLLYRAGIPYRAEQGTENWCSIPETIARGRGDCEDLACWRAAELRVSGENAAAIPERQPVVGRRLYHILVFRPNGTFEDPSRILGMPFSR